MPVIHLDVPGLPKPDTHHHVSVSTGAAHVHVAGQVAIGDDGAPVGPGDLAAQTVQVFRNLAKALSAAGAGLDDIVRLRIYVVDWSPEKIPVLMDGLARVKAEHAMGEPPTSCIGVSMLWIPDFLIEVETTAVIDRVQS